MFYYFSSTIKSALKINGNFYGIIDLDIKPIKIESENAFIELTPVNINAKSISFLLDDYFFSSPPSSIILTDLKGGYLIKFCPLKENNNFYIINQQKFDNLIATIFNENGLKLSLETPSDFYAQSFNLNFDSACIGQFQLNKHNFAYVSVENLENKKLLFVYSIENKIEKVFCREVDNFCVDNGFSTEENYLDIAKHKITSFWEFSDFSFKRTSFKIEKSQRFSINNLLDNIIPFAFLEDLLVNDKIEDYLSQNLLDNIEHLPTFFGDFLGVIPPPEFRSENEVGLIYSKNENSFYIEYFIFGVENKKINSIKKV